MPAVAAVGPVILWEFNSEAQAQQAPRAGHEIQVASTAFSRSR
ncbi:hypothetical protein ACWDTI_08710 [Gordonia sp. NPDC003424]